MNFPQAIEVGFRNYVNFKGRAYRSEYWYWALFQWLAQLVLGIVDMISGIGFLAGIFTLAILLPSLGVSVRRLHDIDKSGWFLLLAFVPLVGIIILIIWACREGTRGANRFGAQPAAA